MKRIFYVSLIALLCVILKITETKNSKKLKRTSQKKRIPPYPIEPDFIKLYISKTIDREKIYDQLFYLNYTSCLHFKVQNTEVRNIGINFFSSKKNNKVILSTSSKKPTNVYLKESTISNTRQLSYYVGLALGLTPEITRYDRDKSVKILWENISSSFKKYFKKGKKYDKNIANTSFDFSSVMLVNPYYGSKNNKKTYKANLSPYEKIIDNFLYFSHNDLKRINYLYCSNKCGKINECKNGGYYEESCNVCKCPFALTGDKCTTLYPSFGNCGIKNNFWASSSKKNMIIQNISGSCFFSIKSKKGKKIKINVIELKLSISGYCEQDINVEIKYAKDKGPVGLKLCDNYKNIDIPALSSEIYIYFSDSRSNNKLNISYREVN